MPFLEAAFVLACTSPDIAIADAIEVSAGATCLDEATLEQSVAMWLERDRIDAGIAVRVEGDPTAPAIVAFEITRDDVSSSPRQMTDLPESCAAVHAAVGLAIAVAIDTSVLGGALQPAPPPAPPVAAVTGVDPSPPTLTDPPAPVDTPVDRSRAVTGHGSLGAAIGIGLTPGVAAYGADLRGGLALRVPVAFELGAAVLVDPHGRLADGRLRSVLGFGHSRICGALTGRRVIARGCVGVAAGAMQVRGLGLPGARATAVPWVAVGPAFELWVPARGRARASVRIDLWVSTMRTRIEGGGPGDTVAATTVVPPVGIGVVIGGLARSR